MKYFDDDMDELFNKAGRQYPLKTEPKNWETVRGALLQEQGTADITQKSKNWRRLLPLLLLLLIPAVYVFIDKNNINKDNIDKNNITKNSIDKNLDKERVSNSEQSVKTTQSTVTKEQTEKTNQSSDREVKQLSYVPPSKHSLRNVTKDDEESVNPKGGLSDPPQAGMIKGKSDHFTQLTLATDIKDNPAAWNNFPSLNTGLSGLNEPSEVILLDAPVRSLNQSNGSESVPNSDKKIKNKKGLYYGLIAGPDLTTIKGQQIKGMGYSAGVILGYTLNNHWQLEGGAMWSRKKYYTDGKYFSKAGAQIPPNVNIHWLDGGCEMLEFPVVVRYNLSAKKNTFFGSAGLTSYIMKNEDYNYSAQAGTSGYDYPGYKMYKRSGDHLFANLQLSAGYKYSLSSKLNIRIEPYLKMPLKKIGIGKMPITSTGLYFGITRDFR